MTKRTSSTRQPRHVSVPAVLAPLLVLGVLVLIGVTAQTSRAGSKPLPPPGPIATVSGPGYQGAYGIPAIQPRASLANSTGPRFTADDVRAYIKTHRPPNTVSGTPDPVIVSIQFMPAKDWTVKYGTLGGTTGSTPICVVTLSGTFILSDGPYLGSPHPYHQGDMIFDGYTGNLLASSVG